MTGDMVATVRRTAISGGVRKACGIAFASIMFAAAALHLYWALGGMWGIANASDGTYGAGHPLSAGMRLVMWGFVVVLPIAGALVLMRVGAVPGVLPARLVAAGCWALALIVLGVTVGAFAGDADLWGLPLRGPVCLIASILALVVALQGDRAHRQGDAAREAPQEAAPSPLEGGAS